MVVWGLAVFWKTWMSLQFTLVRKSLLMPKTGQFSCLETYSTVPNLQWDIVKEFPALCRYFRLLDNLYYLLTRYRYPQPMWAIPNRKAKIFILLTLKPILYLFIYLFIYLLYIFSERSRCDVQCSSTCWTRGRRAGRPAPSPSSQLSSTRLTSAARWAPPRTSKSQVFCT